jgi:hypothetical protein
VPIGAGELIVDLIDMRLDDGGADGAAIAISLTISEDGIPRSPRGFNFVEDPDVDLLAHAGQGDLSVGVCCNEHSSRATTLRGRTQLLAWYIKLI